VVGLLVALSVFIVALIYAISFGQRIWSFSEKKWIMLTQKPQQQRKTKQDKEYL
jgi:hypothetical protein